MATTRCLSQPAVVHGGHVRPGAFLVHVTGITLDGLDKPNVVTQDDVGNTIHFHVKFDQAMDTRDAPWVGIYDGDPNALRV